MEGGYDMNHLFIGLYAYLMGFLVLGIYWTIHQYIFHFIRRSNGVLAWLNVMFLILAALVPLTTKVNQVHVDSYPGYVFYTISTVFSMWFLLVIWKYATSGHRLVAKDLNQKSIDFINNIILWSTMLFVLIVAVTYFVPWFGYLGFIPMGYVIASIATGNDRPWKSFGKR